MKSNRFNNRENECINFNGREIWLSRDVTIVTTVLQIFDGKVWVLMAKRGPASPNAVGKWNLPCGYMDWDEDGPEAAKREAWEETGVYLDDFEKYFLYNRLEDNWRLNTKPDGVKQNVSIHYGVLLDLSNVTEYPEITDENAAPGEVSAIGWFPIGLIDGMKDDIAFNHDQRIKEFYNLCTEYLNKNNPELNFDKIPLE